MIDYHVHIGQWFNVYYPAEAVFTALKNKGVDEIWFSSTSSERYCTESPAVLCGKVSADGLPSPDELYKDIRIEISQALKTAGNIKIKAHPLYWVIPEVHFSDVVTIEQAMKQLPYKGFKLHPRGNEWNLSDKRTIELTEQIFSYAEAHSLLILIHCGPDAFELPVKFESFIASHPKVMVQLAHTRPLEETLYMLRRYPNTLCDTAFVSDDVKQAVIAAGFAKRLRYGSDFPITHWYAAHPSDDNEITVEALEAVLH